MPAHAPYRPLLLLALILALLAPAAAPLTPPPPAPTTAAHPPQPLAASRPDLTPDALAAAPSAGSVSLPGLRAVLVVGPIDGPAGSWTLGEVDASERAARELEANGVAVSRFYPPADDWNAIRAAAQGAHFFFYRGHGVSWGGSSAQPIVGGMALTSGFVSSDAIRQDLHLAPHAIVMLYGCFTAGTSDTDRRDIGFTEAARRVAQYSSPFFDNGAGGYYANWWADAFQMFVRNLFAGQTLGDAYRSYDDFTPANLETGVHPDHPELPLWLDKDNWGYWQYNNAFVGQANATLNDLFVGPVMAVAPTQVRAVAAAPGGLLRFDASQSAGLRVSVTVRALNGAPFNWAAEIEAGAPWVRLAAASGPSSQPVVLILTPPTQPGVYDGGLVIHATSAGILDGVQRVPISLTVMQVNQQIFLPLTP